MLIPKGMGAQLLYWATCGSRMELSNGQASIAVRVNGELHERKTAKPRCSRSCSVERAAIPILLSVQRLAQPIVLLRAREHSE